MKSAFKTVGLLAGLLLIWPAGLIAQQKLAKGQVVNPQGQPLPFVNITAGPGLGTTTDLDGAFELPLPAGADSLRFSYLGFKPTQRAIKREITVLKVVLKPEKTELKEVTETAAENNANRMIRAATAARTANSPQSLKTFRYRSYSKFVVTAHPDSIDPSIKVDTVPTPQGDSLRYDSSAFAMHKIMEKQHFFFMETLTERRYAGPNDDHEKVIAQRTSGFENPLFALVATQLQSFSFYENYVKILGREYLNPISPKSPQRYFFLLRDTAIHAPGDTTYYLHFRPRPQKGFSAITGVLALRTPDWAIESIRARPVDTGGIPLTVRQSYRRYAPQQWFPYQFEARFSFDNVRIGSAQPEGIFRRQLHGIELNPALNKKDIPPVKVEIAETDRTASDSLLGQFRPGELSQREKTTYSYMDSLGDAENLDRRLKLLLALSRGYLPWGPVNVELDKILGYNTYEGFRLGAGLHTNDQFSRWLRFSGYFAYGFKDATSKYGLEARATLEPNLKLNLLVGTRYDLQETGGFYLPQLERPAFTDNGYRRFNIETWDYARQHYAALQVDPLPHLSLDLRLRYEERRTAGDYRYLPRQSADAARSGLLRYLEFAPSLRWAPREEFAHTPTGKLRLRPGYPIFFLGYTRGFPGPQQARFGYHQVQGQIRYRKRTLRLGITELQLRAATTWGQVPYQKLWTPTANMPNEKVFWQRLQAPADRRSFETMRFNSFINQSYVELMWRQDFRTLLFSRPHFKPHLEMVHRVAWGRPTQRADHTGLPTRSLKHGYFESGLELNRLFTTDLLGLGYGLGFYYRYGAYTSPDWHRNLAVKFTFKF